MILKGNFPLEAFLLFAGRDVLKGQNIFKRSDEQISPVLPITLETFNQILTRIQNQSNMVVRVDPTKFISQKFADEGSASPFWARLFLGILRLADIAIVDAGKRGEFHKTLAGSHRTFAGRHRIFIPESKRVCPRYGRLGKK